jgi:hypothetical protein
MIDKAMVEARCLSAEALEMMAKANEMCINERNCASSRIREERAHHSRQSERLGRKQATSIEKLHQEQGSLVNEVQSKFNMKLHKARAKRPVSELAAHLRMIIVIREEKKLTPPKDPALVMPKLCKLPTLGTATKQLMESEANAVIDENQFRKEANEL